MSSSKQARKWVYSTRPTGEVSEQHYRCEIEDIPTADSLKDGEIAIQTLYCSVDPYMRIQQASSDTWEAPHPLGTVQGGGTVGRIIHSKAGDNFVPGTIVAAYTGWREYAVLEASSARILDPEKAPIEYALGILGMPGRTAFFGLREAGKPKPGETVVVSGAAGAVGSIVVQLAKIWGCNVVGIAGSDEKLEILRELGADKTINYKKYPTALDMQVALQEAAPEGIDVYFDNVGGVITDAVISLINVRARIVICGQISQYNGGLDNPAMGPRFLHRILYTRATIQGILSRDFSHRMDEMINELAPLIEQGKLSYKQTIIEGFENLPAALAMLFKGENIGKLLVKISD